MLDDEQSATETDQIVTLLQLAAGDLILDAPCGHGRISNLLARRGCRVVGLDRSSGFLARARLAARGAGVDVQNVQYVQGDLRALPLHEGFDAAICWFTSFGYFDDHDNRRVLDEYRRVLRRGGRLLIETLHHDAFVRRFDRAPLSRVSRVGDDMLIDENEFDPLMGRIETDRTVVRDGQMRHSHHSVRLLTPPEFVTWLGDAGFETVTFMDRRGEPLSLDSWRLVVIAS